MEEKELKVERNTTSLKLKIQNQKLSMKTAYELAMERLNKTPPKKLSEAQKKELAELASKSAAKIAGREIALKDEIAKAGTAGDFEKLGELQEQLVADRKKLQSELAKKRNRCGAANHE